MQPIRDPQSQPKHTPTTEETSGGASATDASSPQGRTAASPRTDLRAPSATPVTLSTTNTVEEAIQKFKEKVITQYGLDDHSPMPTKMILEPLEDYSPEEINSFAADFERLKSSIDEAKSTGSAIVTMGSPGSGKSMHFEGIAHREKYALLDFDRVALVGLSTFQLQKTSGTDPEKNYEKYRAASQVIHNCLLPYTISKGKDFALAITSTSPFFKPNMDFFSGKGYTVEIHLMTCPHEVRTSSNEIRNQRGDFQCTSDDLIAKGGALYSKTRECSTYPNLQFWYRSAPNAAPVLAATVKEGILTIIDKTTLEAIINTHYTEDPKTEGQSSGDILRALFDQKQQASTSLKPS